MATKKRNPEMTPWQRLHHKLRAGAPTADIRSICNELLTDMINIDASRGLLTATNPDIIMVLHTMTARLQCLERENETLRRKLRRDNRRPAKKPEAELLKKTASNEPPPEQV